MMITTVAYTGNYLPDYMACCSLDTTLRPTHTSVPIYLCVLSSMLSRHVVCYKCTHVSEEHTASSLRVKHKSVPYHVTEATFKCGYNSK